jgi:hypothetical protein
LKYGNLPLKYGISYVAARTREKRVNKTGAAFRGGGLAWRTLRYGAITVLKSYTVSLMDTVYYKQ